MNNLAQIISSKARAEFFRILFGINSNEFHLREIQRRSGMAIDTVRKEAMKLEEMDLVTKRIDGNRTYYSGNKQHPLYAPIHDLVLKTSGLTDVLKIALLKHPFKFVFVFGSIAAGKEKAESDIDLFMIGDAGLRKISKLLKEPSQMIGREINPHIMTEKEFLKRKNQKEHFVTSVLRSPKLMVIGIENELAELG